VSRVTSKLQITIPKAVADAQGIAPGSDVFFESAGEVVRLRTTAGDAPAAQRPVAERLALFDAATRRQARRARRSRAEAAGTGRGWTRDELYVSWYSSLTPTSWSTGSTVASGRDVLRGLR
jgi:AbrB family looped-hinge helix DNA binding protein